MKSRNKYVHEIASFCFLILSLLFTQCRLQPRGVPVTKEMKEIVRDMLLLQASKSTEDEIVDSIYRLEEEAVLDKHGLSRTEYDSSINWYAKNAHLLTGIYEELMADLQQQGMLLDSAIVDSTELYHVHYLPVLSLWNGASRISLFASRSLYFRSQSLPVLSSGDTLDFKVLVRPSLTNLRSLELLLLSKDTAGVVRDKQSFLLKSGDRADVSFVIPEGSTANRDRMTYEFYFKFRNFGAPKDSLQSKFSLITFDSLVLYKRLPPQVPILGDSLLTEPIRIEN